MLLPNLRRRSYSLPVDLEPAAVYKQRDRQVKRKLYAGRGWKLCCLGNITGFVLTTGGGWIALEGSGHPVREMSLWPALALVSFSSLRIESQGRFLIGGIRAGSDPPLYQYSVPACSFGDASIARTKSAFFTKPDSRDIHAERARAIMSRAVRSRALRDST
jgi:hypothetical protein